MKTFLIVILVVILGALGVGYYLYNQVAYTPDWYESANTTEVQKLIASSGEVENEIRQKLQSGKEVDLTSESLTSLVMANVKKKLGVDPEKMIKGLNTKINSDKVTLEAVLNLKDMPQDILPQSAKGFFNKIADLIPGNLFENLYVKIEGKPYIENGAIQLGNINFIQLGNVKYSKDEIMKELKGLENVKQYFPINGAQISDLILNEGTLKLLPK